MKASLNISGEPQPADCDPWTVCQDDFFMHILQRCVSDANVQIFRDNEHHFMLFLHQEFVESRQWHYRDLVPQPANTYPLILSGMFDVERRRESEANVQVMTTLYEQRVLNAASGRYDARLYNARKVLAPNGWIYNELL